MSRFLDLDIATLISELDISTDNKLHKLNHAIGSLVWLHCCFYAFLILYSLQLEDFSMVSFIPLNIEDPDSISEVLLQADTAFQYGEDVDVVEPRDRDIDDDGGDGGGDDDNDFE